MRGAVRARGFRARRKGASSSCGAARAGNSAGPDPGREAGSAVNIVNLALQGGGAHGAFAWGVLDRLLEEAGSPSRGSAPPAPAP